MRIVSNLDDLRESIGPASSAGGAVVTIGVYDGVHRGHHAVLRLVRELADARGLAAVCITFDRHPAEVVRPDSAPKLLTTPQQKLELLAATGYLDVVHVLHFDEARSREAAEDFVQEVLVDAAQARVIVVGADFHFGRARAGNVEMLQRVGRELGFEVLGVGLEAAPGGTVYSSTNTRALLAEGDVAGAAKMLGRPHEVRGTVQQGDQRGRELGFPTANVAVPARCMLPADGIYAGVFVGEDGVERVTAISLGRRPTFYAHQDASLLEAHVLDFSGDLYGQDVAVRFVERLRGEIKFDSVDALVAQMARDVADTRRIVSGGS
ncbi:MAG: bifunctional riboflavin kinase/FAD synthetase [Acidimicrobiia bacterium]